jgi:hypothetical protein
MSACPSSHKKKTVPTFQRRTVTRVVSDIFLQRIEFLPVWLDLMTYRYFRFER